MEILDTVLPPLSPLPPGVGAAWLDALSPRRPLAHDPRRQAMERVLASRTFARTTRLTSFLRYVCVAEMEGRSAVLSEQHIGSRVFDRPEHYNPAEDTIVRTTARLLRQRLESYYAAEGAADPMRIVIPRGGYAPVFTPAAPAAVAPSAAEAGPPVADPVVLAAPEPRDESQSEPQPQPRAASQEAGSRLDGLLKRRVAVGAALALALLVAMATGWYAFVSTSAPRDAAATFWATLFSAEHDTLLVPADSALVTYQQTVHREVRLDDYAAKRLGNDMDDAGDRNPEDGLQFRMRRHTAVASVALAAELGKLAQRAPKRFQVRFARDLQLADLKQLNAILVGVRQANPWVELFRDRVNFHIDWDSASGKFLVRNDRPLAGEEALYEFSAADPDRRAYASIAYLRSLGSDTRVLLLGGTTSAGTEAAAEFLLDPRRLETVLQRARLPDGSVGEFEVLLQSVLHANGSTDTKVLGMRTPRS